MLRIAANLCSVVPGLGHVVLGRCARGLLLFFLCAVFLNGSYLARYLVGEADVPRVTRGCLAAAGLVWAYSLTDVFRITYWRRRKAFFRKKRRLFLDVHRAYAGNRLEEARDLLRKVVRMDPEGPAGHFYLGLVYRDLGRTWLARKRFKRALWVDPSKAWRLEVQVQLALLKRMRRA